MNKAYERINWENYPSEKTPLNEDNLNKIDVALDEVDNRVVAQETTKLDKATANTMVKDVAFDETTGIFTITFLNGVTKTLDTKLEKIATNFHYDYATQKLILTLVDGTTQEIDMKALITQYEFENSAYISWTITSDGKIKADIINGSITADKLQPNFLADVTLQANNAKTSEQNAKISEENAKESEINAKNYADSAEPIASTVSGTNPTLDNSTDAPIISMQIDGKTTQDGTPTPDAPVDIHGVGESGSIEVKTTGKNIFGGLAFAQALVDSGSTNVVLDTSAKTVTYGHNTTDKVRVLFDKFKENTRYTLILGVKDHVNAGTALTSYNLNLRIHYTDGTTDLLTLTKTATPYTAVITTAPNKSVKELRYYYGEQDTTTLYYEQCGIFEGVITADEFEPYTETTANIPLSAPLYEGDYIKYNLDGSGEENHNLIGITFDGSDDEQYWLQSINSHGIANFQLPITIALWDNTVKSNRFTRQRTLITDTTSEGIFNNPDTMYIRIKKERASTVDEFRSWLKENPVEVICKVPKPTVTPLTAEQIAEFDKLRTFDGVTNVVCEGECEVEYFRDSVGGRTVAMIANMVKKVN